MNTKGYGERKCEACADTFWAMAPRQKRCRSCIDKGKRPESVRTCACGCGEFTRWNASTKMFATWKTGHHSRVNPPRANLGKPSPRKGTGANLRRRCQQCKKWVSGLAPSIAKKLKFCSMTCRAQYYSDRGTSYKRVRVRGSLVRVHRLVMADQLGRALRSREVVHHMDENIRNNVVENLFLFHCDACHRHFHRWDVPLQYSYHKKKH